MTGFADSGGNTQFTGLFDPAKGVSGGFETTG